MKKQPLLAGFVLLVGILCMLVVPMSALAQEKGKELQGSGDRTTIKQDSHEGHEHATIASAVMKLKKGDGLKAQTTCPLMGKPVNKKFFVDAGGYRLYLCCAKCTMKAKANPQKAIAMLKTKGQKPEVRLAICAKCGEIKGLPACCTKDAAKCVKCGLTKGSPGCCQDLKLMAKLAGAVLCPGCGQVKGLGAPHVCSKDAEICAACSLAVGSPACCANLTPAVKGQNVVLCTSCGQLMGSATCCSKDAAKCAKCGLAKGSPGCCNADLKTLASLNPTNDVLLCPDCGQVKNSAQCCVKTSEKCVKCGLAKGSPGCCKIPLALRKMTP